MTPKQQSQPREGGEREREAEELQKFCDLLIKHKFRVPDTVSSDYVTPDIYDAQPVWAALRAASQPVSGSFDARKDAERILRLYAKDEWTLDVDDLEEVLGAAYNAGREKGRQEQPRETLGYWEYKHKPKCPRGPECKCGLSKLLAKLNFGYQHEEARSTEHLFENVFRCLQSALESECPKPLIKLAVEKLERAIAK